MCEDPVIITTGFGLTTSSRGDDIHPVIFWVKVNVTFPGLTANTEPVVDTEAIVGLLLLQVPPKGGDNVVMDPVQIDVLSALTMGMECTVNSPVSGAQSELLSTNLNFTLPWPIRFTTPDGFTVATSGLVLIHCPA